jgi:hypothetical protein
MSLFHLIHFASSLIVSLLRHEISLLMISKQISDLGELNIATFYVETNRNSGVAVKSSFYFGSLIKTKIKCLKLFILKAKEKTDS